MKLRKAKNIDNSRATMLDNAYYTCKPPAGGRGNLSEKARKLAALTPLER